MRRISSATGLLIAAAGLSGCASGPTGQVTARNNPSLYSVHQPVVQRTDFVLDVDASGDALSYGERARVAAWFDSIELRYGDRLYVEEPREYPSRGARAGIASLVGEYGMFLQPSGAPVAAGTVAPGTIRIIASRAIASVPSCPDWGEKPLPSVATSPNFGCATNANLAAMIADPNDLVLGQQGSVQSRSSVAGRAVRVYRERTPTGGGALPAVSTGGK